MCSVADWALIVYTHVGVCETCQSLLWWAIANSCHHDAQKHNSHIIWTALSFVLFPPLALSDHEQCVNSLISQQNRSAPAGSDYYSISAVGSWCGWVQLGERSSQHGPVGRWLATDMALATAIAQPPLRPAAMIWFIFFKLANPVLWFTGDIFCFFCQWRWCAIFKLTDHHLTGRLLPATSSENNYIFKTLINTKNI